jgi:hypothetical protein
MLLAYTSATESESTVSGTTPSTICAELARLTKVSL